MQSSFFAIAVFLTGPLASAQIFNPKIASGFRHTVAITEDGRVIAWGDNTLGQCNVPAGITNPVKVATWGSHSAALEADGTLHVWGANQFGESNTPSGLGPVLDVAPLFTGTVAVLVDGTMAGWGQNYFCGSGTSSLNVSNINDAVEVMGGNAHWFYKDSTGRIHGRGCNFNGQLNLPPGALFPLDYEPTESWSCILKADRSLVAIGWNGYGQLNVPPGNDFIDVTTGNYWGMALRSSGSIAFWGRNNKGQGNIPSGMSNVVAIDGGEDQAIAIHSDGSLTMWGDNASGQLDWPQHERIQLFDQDCNGDGIADWKQILLGDLADSGGNGIPDICEQCPPDLDDNGVLNFFDIAAFVVFFQTQDPRADYNADGLFNFFDFSEYLTAFNAGCP